MREQYFSNEGEMPVTSAHAGKEQGREGIQNYRVEEYSEWGRSGEAQPSTVSTSQKEAGLL